MFLCLHKNWWEGEGVLEGVQRQEARHSSVTHTGGGKGGGGGIMEGGQRQVLPPLHTKEGRGGIMEGGQGQEEADQQEGR